MTIGTERIERARMEADQARERLASTLGAVQHRLRPGTLMSNAWDGVKEKSGAAADGALDAVKARPVAVSGVVAAVALFLAREPIRELISDLFARGSGKGNVDTDEAAEAVSVVAPRLAEQEDQGLAAPPARRTTRRTRAEGVSA